MKRSAKTAVLMLICAAMTAAAGSCALSQTYPVTIDGEALRAGVYIYRQTDSVADAVSKLNEEQPDLDTSADGFSYLNQTVEGVKFEDYVNNKTLDRCREYVAVERLFDSKGLTLTAEELSDIDAQVKQVWTVPDQYYAMYGMTRIWGEYYGNLGVGQESFRDIEIEEKKKDKLFDFLYGDEGEFKATEDEINEALKTDYSMVNYIEYTLENGDGAQSYADKITAGSTFEQVYQELKQAENNEKFEKEKAEAEAAAAEEAENAENAENSEDTEETEYNEDTENTEDESTEEAPTEPEQAELPETDSLIEVLKKDATSPSEDFVVQVMDMAAGDVKVITTEDGTSYIVQKLDILSKPEKTESEVETLKKELREDDFEELLKTTGAAYSVVEDGSKGLYTVKGLMDRQQSFNS